MQPPVLIRVPPDQLFQPPGEPLGQPSQVGRFLTAIQRIRNRLAAYLQLQGSTNPPGVRHHHGGVVGQREQGDGLVGRGGAAEEFNPIAIRPGRLVRQDHQRSAAGQQPINAVRGAPFGQYQLAVRAAKRVQEAVQPGIVEGTSDREGGKAEQTHDLSPHFKTAEMARDQHRGPAAQQLPDHGLLVVKSHMPSPVGQVNFSLGVRDFHDHQDQVLPLAASEQVAGGQVELGKGEPQIFLQDQAADSQQVVGQVRQGASQPLASFQGQGLDGGDRQPDGKVHQKVRR